MLTYDICLLINTEWYKLHYYERLYGPQEYMFSSSPKGMCAELYCKVLDRVFNKHLNLLKYASRNGYIKLVEYIYFNETDIPNKNCMCYYIWSGDLSVVKWAYKNKICWHNHELVSRIQLILGNVDVLQFMYDHFPRLKYYIGYCIVVGNKDVIKWLLTTNNTTLDELYKSIIHCNIELLDWYNSELILI